jgi:hypothetical protein
MSNSVSTTATTSLTLLSSEAASLLDQAKKYREMMDGLPAEDPKRQIYEAIIRDLLERSNRLSSFVVTTTSSKP